MRKGARMESWGVYLIVFLALYLAWRVGRKRKKRGGRTKPRGTVNTIETEEEFDNDKWRPNVAGVTHKNPDGTDRQKIIAGLKPKEPLLLKRDQRNKYDSNAIGVFTQSGEQIGWIPGELSGGTRQYAYFMDRGGKLTAKVYRVIGGGRRKNYGCLLDIKQGDIPYLVKESEAKELMDKAKSLENSKPKEAIGLYEQAIQVLDEADRIFQETIYYKSTRSWLRKTKNPISRLTLLLEKTKRYKECLEVIERYERPQQVKRPLSKPDLDSLCRRKARVMKKLSQTAL